MARAAVGVHGDANAPAWKEAAPPAARRRIQALALVTASITTPAVTFLLLLPFVLDDEGWSPTSTAIALILGVVVCATLALPLSTSISASRRAKAIVVFAFNAAALALFVHLLPGFTFFAWLLVAHGVVLAFGGGLVRPYVYDSVVPEARARAFGRVLQGGFFGAVLGAVLAYLAIDGPRLGVGQALLGSAVLAIALSLFSLRLTDVEVGGIERQRLALINGAEPGPVTSLRPSFRDGYARAMTIPTVRASLTAYVGVGWCLGLSLITPVVRIAEIRDYPVRTPSIVVAVVGIVCVVTISILGRRIEATRRSSPEALARLVRTGLLIGATGLFLTVLIPFTLSPQLALAAIGASIAWIALELTVLSVVQPSDRSAVAGATTFSLIGGGVLSFFVVNFVAGISSSDFRYSTAFLLAALPVLLFARRAKRLVRSSGADLDALLGVDDDSQDFMDEIVSEGGSAPVLAARGINFSYGSVQVLFDVDLRVGDGEMVALLGPNGVGKTTLLRVLSGLETPQGGTIRLGGEDVTDVPSSRRVGMGISQIVGGNAVFGSMTVAENLQMYGFSMGRDRASISSGIDEAFAMFPRLADRRNQLGSTLSGGEQQMLGLSKALITKPRILVVDEFSLGLAPIIVGELLGMVRSLNASGTAILIVEQSVNVALNLVDRCYFMEKGQVVYEGRSADLLAQPELVQALSLGGVPHDLEGTHA
jgi:ABC-type branched-subunit amino acid transport system ATPase component